MTRTEILAKFDLIARRRIALTTERSYRSWITKYLAFLPTENGRKATTSEAKMELFLTSMAHEDYSSVSQNQAFNALLFLYRHVLRSISFSRAPFNISALCAQGLFIMRIFYFMRNFRLQDAHGLRNLCAHEQRPIAKKEGSAKEENHESCAQFVNQPGYFEAGEKDGLYARAFTLVVDRANRPG